MNDLHNTAEMTAAEIANSVDIDTIRAAADRIAPYIVRTPLLESPRLNDALGFRLLVKPECLQHTGSFKLRGATNAVMSLDDDVTDVVAFSSGNPRRQWRGQHGFAA